MNLKSEVFNLILNICVSNKDGRFYMGKRIKIVLAVIFMIPLVLILFIMISSSNETKNQFLL